MRSLPSSRVWKDKDQLADEFCCGLWEKYLVRNLMIALTTNVISYIPSFGLNEVAVAINNINCRLEHLKEFVLISAFALVGHN